MSLIIFSLLMSMSHASERTHVVCNTIIISKERKAYKLDVFTDAKRLIPDGVYHTEAPWCLYKVLNGTPIELESDKEQES